MRWAVTLLAVGSLILGGAWLLLSSGGETLPPPPSVATETAESAPGGPANAASGSLGDGPDVHRPDVGADAEREEVSGDGSSAAAPGPATEVLVVRGTPPEPVAGAEVLYLNDREYRKRNPERKLSRWDAAERFGQRVRTNAEGKASLPGGRWYCAARHEGWFAYRTTSRRGGTTTLTLQLDEQLQIVTRLADGTAPSGQRAIIPIAIQQQDEPDDTDTIWRGATDANGRAVVRHLQLMRKGLDDDAPEDFRERFAVVARLPTNPVTMTEFDGRPAPAEPVVLTLPPLGSIEAVLVDHQGRRLRSPARVGISTRSSQQQAATRPDPGAMRIERGGLSQSVNKPVGTESVALPFTQVGQPVEVYARYRNDRRSARSVAAQGPKAAGETALVEVPLLPSHCVFSGRLLLPSGKPIASDDVATTFWEQERVRHRVRTYTDAAGGWDLVMTSAGSAGAGSAGRWSMEFRLLLEQPAERNGAAGVATDGAAGVAADGAAGPAGGSRWVGATVELPPWPPGKRIELGEIQLRELPPLAAGLVVDDLGVPVAKASISVQQLQATPASPSRGGNRLGAGPLFSSGRESFVRETLRVRSNRAGSRSRPANTERWRSIRQLATRSREDGTFEIFGDLPEGKLRIVADSREHFSSNQPLAGPSTDLRLAIPREGELAGRVLLPEWMPDRAVTVTMRPFDESRRQTETQRTRVSGRRGSRGSGYVRIQPLRPGRYDLLVTVRNLREPLATIADVFVQPGNNADPRLAPLDLRQAMHRYRLHARDEASQTLAIDGPIHARLQQDDGTFVEAGFRWSKGRAELITAHALAELTFFGRGFEPLKQQFAPGDHDVYLKTLRPALVQVPGARSLCGPTRKVRISAILQGDTGMPGSLSGTDQRSGRRFSFARWDLGKSSGGWLEQTDVVEIPLMTAGKYEIILRAHATESTRTQQASVTLGTFELTPGNATPVTVSVPAQQVTDALAGIDKRHQEQVERRAGRAGGRSNIRPR